MVEGTGLTNVTQMRMVPQSMSMPHLGAGRWLGLRLGWPWPVELRTMTEKEVEGNQEEDNLYHTRIVQECCACIGVWLLFEMSKQLVTM